VAELEEKGAQHCTAEYTEYTALKVRTSLNSNGMFPHKAKENETSGSSDLRPVLPEK